MSKRLDIVAQTAMDLFYSEYKGDDDFFNIDDFVLNCGNTLSDLYLQEYRIQYQQIRQEKRDEVVAFSSEWLFSEVLDVKLIEGEYTSILSQRVMSFPYDSQNVGLQEVIGIVPRGTCLERSNLTEVWQYKYLPQSGNIFYRLKKDKILFFKNGACNINKIEAFYVPSPAADSEVPDGVINYVVNTTVSVMKQILAGVVVDKSNDDNPNKILQSEINKTSLIG